MRVMQTLKAGAATLALALALAACGGGGADGGIGGTGNDGNDVAYGEITGFGSVWINGVRYDTSDASFELDGRAVQQADLRVGMVARVQGSVAEQAAGSVVVRSALKGRVEQVVDDTLMIVLGQAVRVDAGTTFDDGVRPVAGDYVEVHGLPLAGGAIAASYVERKSTLATPPFVVTGFVTAHDAAAGTFMLGELTVGTAGAERGDMPAGSWDGLLVEVKGNACAGSPVCGTLTATEVEPAGPQLADDAEAELEGFVTGLVSGGFVLGGQTVLVDAGTAFENGSAADLAVGVKLEVEGQVSGGVLTAGEIEFRDSVRIEADVLAYADGTLTLAGLPGVTVQIGSFTKLDKVPTIASLVAGNHVRVRGRPAAGGTVVATELELRSAFPEARVALRGPVDAVAAPNLTILGVTIDTSGIADDEFQDDDTVIGRTGFFNRVAAGTAVELQGELVGGVVLWDEAELED